MKLPEVKTFAQRIRLDPDPEAAAQFLFELLDDEIRYRDENGEPTSCLDKLLDWVFPPAPPRYYKTVIKGNGFETVETTKDDPQAQESVPKRRRGRPSVKRYAAVQALVLKQYIPQTWEQIYAMVCPCGKPHTPSCSASLKTEVAILKRKMRECGLSLPSFK